VEQVFRENRAFRIYDGLRRKLIENEQNPLRRASFIMNFAGGKCFA
jgi:hypothetical protein